MSDLIHKVVEYKGTGRPYLHGLKGKVISQVHGSRSARVLFTRYDGTTVEEFVGTDYLRVLESEKDTESLKILRSKLKDLDPLLKNLEQEKELLDRRVNSLSNRVHDLRNTIALLEQI